MLYSRMASYVVETMGFKTPMLRSCRVLCRSFREELEGRKPDIDSISRPKAMFQPRLYSVSRSHDFEQGLVSGGSLAWADSDAIQMRRRAVLKWNAGSPSKVLIVKKPGDKAAEAKLIEIGEWLKSHGLEVFVERQVARTVGQQFSTFDARESSGIDLAITLGGDGTVLHLASLFQEDAPMPPTLSFAMGTLGFLTPFASSMSQSVLSKLLWPPRDSESVYLTLHSRKRCEIWNDGVVKQVYRVLNECTVDRGAFPHVLMLELFIDGSHVTTIHADALIMSTPSGSTAYAMSAGGPMVAPSVPCTILTPVAPQSLSFRPIVVPESAEIEIQLPSESRSRSARAAFDGRNTVHVKRETSLLCRPCQFALPMITMHPLDEDWYEGITQKLNWAGSLHHHHKFNSFNQN